MSLPLLSVRALMRGMSAFIGSIPLPPRTLNDEEQAALLNATGQRRGAFRDHLLFSLALATGLREHELVALNIGDIADHEGRIRRRLVLRVFKRSTSTPAPQDVPLSETIRIKLAKFIGWKTSHQQSVAPDAPLFVSRKKAARLSTRQVRHLFAQWQERAGFTRHFNFHAVRHASVTNIFRDTKDIGLAQMFARHKSILSTMRYNHPDEAELVRAVQHIRC
ncbi:MAG: tyrosine-type recombinase/integrase [Pseudomonadota bacterium]